MLKRDIVKWFFWNHLILFFVHHFFLYFNVNIFLKSNFQCLIKNSDNLSSRLDGKHVVFGEVTSGYDTVVKEMEKNGTNGGAPKKPIKITNCGVL